MLRGEIDCAAVSDRHGADFGIGGGTDNLSASPIKLAKTTSTDPPPVGRCPRGIPRGRSARLNMSGLPAEQQV